MGQIRKRKLETLEEKPKTQTTFMSQNFGEIRKILAENGH